MHYPDELSFDIAEENFLRASLEALPSVYDEGYSGNQDPVLKPEWDHWEYVHMAECLAMKICDIDHNVRS
jgi:hypothetical protein